VGPGAAAAAATASTGPLQHLQASQGPKGRPGSSGSSSVASISAQQAGQGVAGLTGEGGCTHDPIICVIHATQAIQGCLLHCAPTFATWSGGRHPQRTWSTCQVASHWNNCICCGEPAGLTAAPTITNTHSDIVTIAILPAGVMPGQQPPPTPSRPGMAPSLQQPPGRCASTGGGEAAGQFTIRDGQCWGPGGCKYARLLRLFPPAAHLQWYSWVPALPGVASLLAVKRVSAALKEALQQVCVWCGGGGGGEGEATAHACSML
jgi:hypothetical protein